MSITNLRGYGDVDRIKQDAPAMRDILSRQGSSFVVDCIAESIGDTVAKFKIPPYEASTLRDKILNDLREAINERI